MKIEKETTLGKVIIDIPVEIGDTMVIRGSQYSINCINVFSNEKIFLVNRSSGLWINIFDIEEYKKDGRYLRITKLKEIR